MPFGSAKCNAMQFKYRVDLMVIQLLGSAQSIMEFPQSHNDPFTTDTAPLHVLLHYAAAAVICFPYVFPIEQIKESRPPVTPPVICFLYHLRSQILTMEPNTIIMYFTVSVYLYCNGSWPT